MRYSYCKRKKAETFAATELFGFAPEEERGRGLCRWGAEERRKRQLLMGGVGRDHRKSLKQGFGGREQDGEGRRRREEGTERVSKQREGRERRWDCKEKRGKIRGWSPSLPLSSLFSLRPPSSLTLPPSSLAPSLFPFFPCVLSLLSLFPSSPSVVVPLPSVLSLRLRPSSLALPRPPSSLCFSLALPPSSLTLPPSAPLPPSSSVSHLQRPLPPLPL